MVIPTHQGNIVQTQDLGIVYVKNAWKRSGKNCMRRSNLTEDLLLTISEHLSGRRDCEGVEYLVRIGNTPCDKLTDDERRYMSQFNDYPQESICMYPSLKVFPDIHHRKIDDKKPILHHVLQRHFPDLFVESVTYTGINLCKLVPGTYKYVMNPGTKRRQWKLL